MKDEDLPPLKEQAANLFGALKDILANSLKMNKVIASDDLIKKRLDVCVQCENYIAEKKRCKSCGCYLNKKVLLMGVECPLKKLKILECKDNE